MAHAAHPDRTFMFVFCLFAFVLLFVLFFSVLLCFLSGGGVSVLYTVCDLDFDGVRVVVCSRARG